LEEGKSLDLQAVFTEFKQKLNEVSGKLGHIEKEVKEVSKTANLAYQATEQEYQEFMEKCLEAGKSMEECAKEWRAKATTSKEVEQYPAPKVARLLEFLKGLVGKEFTAEHFDKAVSILGAKAKAPYKAPYKAPTSEEKPKEPKEPKKGGEQYPAPAIAKVLRYLKRKLNAREFQHVLDLLGVEAEELGEDIKAILPIGKTGEEDITKHPVYKLLTESQHYGE